MSRGKSTNYIIMRLGNKINKQAMNKKQNSIESRNKVSQGRVRRAREVGKNYTRRTRYAQIRMLNC